MATQTASVNGIRLAYRLEGPAGAPVVMLANSLGTSMAMWADQVPALMQRYRVLRYDLRGHGDSQAPGGAYSIAQLGDDAAGLIDALGLGQVHVVGLSLGGMVAQALALNHPEKVARLVLAGTTCGMPDPAPWTERIQKVRDQGTAAVADGIVANWFTPDFAQASPQTVESVRQQILATPDAGYAGCCAAVRDLALCDRLGEIAHPAMLLAGGDDPVTPPDTVAGLAERLPHAQQVTLPGARHLMNVERPGAFNETLLGFLDTAGR